MPSVLAFFAEAEIALNSSLIAIMHLSFRAYAPCVPRRHAPEARFPPPAAFPVSGAGVHPPLLRTLPAAFWEPPATPLRRSSVLCKQAFRFRRRRRRGSRLVFRRRLRAPVQEYPELRDGRREAFPRRRLTLDGLLYQNRALHGFSPRLRKSCGTRRRSCPCRESPRPRCWTRRRCSPTTRCSPCWWRASSR